MDSNAALSPDELKCFLDREARRLGFDQARVSQPNLEEASARLRSWLDAGYHGDMQYMARHDGLRRHPEVLHPGTIRVVSLALSYLGEPVEQAEAALADAGRGYISRYALGRDYHKVLRARLQQLARLLEQVAGPFRYRVFTDSAPVMEVEIACQGGLGWRGKHTLLLRREAGSFFFLGEIFTDLPLPIDPPLEDHCGSCRACLDICPTQAILGPYRLDATRCISYLTIEHKGTIPLDLRPLIGNRVYGCDDCQLVCPWNRFARQSVLPDFSPRPGLAVDQLPRLLSWTPGEFETRLAGSAIRRIGHERWLRNVAVALGNGPAHPEALRSLGERQNHPSPLVREHVNWALERLSE